MSEDDIRLKVKEVEAKLVSLEKKIDLLLTMIIQEVSTDFEDDGDSEVMELPDILRGHPAFEFKQDSELN